MSSVALDGILTAYQSRLVHDNVRGPTPWNGPGQLRTQNTREYISLRSASHSSLISRIWLTNWQYEIDKKLGMSGLQAVEEIGIEKYNEECRAIVMRYSTEWRQTIERLGRWIDFDNDYKVNMADEHS